MRFLADGPSIPDELLVARDEGRVVFFCGAGVSRARAGLSDFFGLARTVVDQLGATQSSPARKLIELAETLSPIDGVGSLISADRVFGLLEREFLPGDISKAVAKALKPPLDVDLSAHRILLDLARGPDGKVRLVTTNFDLLFETCDGGLQRSTFPKLPDPQRNDDFIGIIHLHGHVDDEYKDAAGDGFVISSPEFGRAYLSDGWGTRFIQSVLERFFVVFVGYTADDPPVQYLLEALNRTSGSRDGLYAFQSGSINDAQSRWSHKGVQPIAYSEADSHSALWETLSAWSLRARDSDAWYDEVIRNARRGPESLKPHERGQVAHIVSTLQGSRKFAFSEDPPPATWLCTFDPAMRFAKPGRLGTMTERGPFFDPFDAYGLDADFIPAKVSPDDDFAKREVPIDAWNCFALNRHDRENMREDSFAALSGHWSVNIPNLTSRLANIGGWISKVSNQPASAWWAATQTGIHPEIQNQIRWGLEKNSNDCPAVIRKAWRYILNAWETRRMDFFHDLFRLTASVKADGWSDIAVREFAYIHRPYIKVASAYFSGPRPPEIAPIPKFRSLLNLDVEYPSHNETIPIPEEKLSLLVKEFRRNLEIAVALEGEIGGYGLTSISPIEPETDISADSFSRDHGLTKLFLTYISFFRKLLEQKVDLAKQESLAWQSNNDPVFNRLKIWICGERRLTTNAGTGKFLRELDQESF